MATYSTYKDSGQQWLGMIPSHWNIDSLKHLFTVRSTKGHPELPQLCSTQRYGVIPQSLYENRVVSVLTGLDTLKVVCVGDFVISLRSFQGGIEYAYYGGIISPAYTILEPTTPSNSPYYRYLLKSQSFIQLLQSTVTGIREGQNIDYGRLRYESIPIPPAEEQEAIVEYLDKVTADIDKAIEATERIIAALEERRKIIITQAVTRGINPDVPLRDSGIDWLGHIPAHWNVLPLKRISKLILGKMLDNSGGESSSQIYPYICAKDVHFDGVDITDLKEMYFSDSEINRYRVQEGDLLVVEGGAGAGGCAIVKNLQRIIGIQNSIIIVRAKNNSDNEYLSYFVQSLVRRGYIDYSCNKATIPHFTKDKIGVVPIALPPIQEQKDIIAYIRAMEIPIDNSIARQKHLIELLRERKNIIINETVTGKKKVI